MTWHDYVAAVLIGLLGLVVLWLLMMIIPACVYVHHDVTVIAVGNSTELGVDYDERANADD